MISRANVYRSTMPSRRSSRPSAPSLKKLLNNSPPDCNDPPHRQGQLTTIALPREDLRAFIRLEAGAPARAQSSYAILTPIREKLVEKQAEWAAELGAMTGETNKEWFTYVISDFPRRLTDFHGNEVDSNSIISNEIEILIGFKHVDVRPSRQFSDNPLAKTLLMSFLKPTKIYWSLFGSRAARLIDKTDRLRQCEICWDYHSVRHCHRQPVCQRCGKTGHPMDDYTALEQCINCLGSHAAGFLGAETYRQRHPEPQPETQRHAA
ncbi:hypothetical protein FOMG_19156 [Fusarium oxysporum f. sp. melonis 26406]|uniref:CCHC-type domain-containing protein n=1 Tax=Fusarium oxysporum f. sp. melonis 26406 TaxID=1089452 RepID=W9ZSP1_FUSOX|nr:hypothetical protein FOMG_19156 [Fusarium oxysporum f. sp. melonis 26406]